MKRAKATSYPVSIFIAGDPDEARRICRNFCDEEGLCVTVTPTSYVYTGGEEQGVVVGLINYPRFPAEPRDIDTIATLLALELLAKLEQQSVSVQTPETTHWFSLRISDLEDAPLAIAAGSGTAETHSGSVRSKPERCPTGNRPRRAA